MGKRLTTSSFSNLFLTVKHQSYRIDTTFTTQYHQRYEHLKEQAYKNKKRKLPFPSAIKKALRRNERLFIRTLPLTVMARKAIHWIVFLVGKKSAPPGLTGLHP